MNLFERVFFVCVLMEGMVRPPISMNDVCSRVGCSLSPLSSFKGVNGWELRFEKKLVFLLEETLGGDGGENSGERRHS